MYNEDIFIIDCWINTENKENDLIGLIKILKTFDIPILLSSHKPIKIEIQNMVDYYIFDKNNPLLLYSEFSDYELGSGFWSKTPDWSCNIEYEFHHDYAIWTTMQNTFNFAKYLGKKYIHFFEYDNLPDPVQYEQAFLEYSRNYDAVIYEYIKDSTKDTHLGEYCATYIFSIKTDVALKVVDQYKTKRDYFYNKPKGWQLERVFLQSLKNITNKYILTKYIANNNELNTQAVWNRDGIIRNDAIFQIFLVTDNRKNLYCEFISGFHAYMAERDYLVEIVYGDFCTFHNIKKNEFSIVKLGKYRKGDRVKLYYKGMEIFNEFLGKNYEEFKKMNKIKFNDQLPPPTININFINGPYVSIKGNVDDDYRVEFINLETNKNVYSTKFNIQSKDLNYWGSASIKYFVNWKIKIKGYNYEFEHIFNAEDKNVFIWFDSKSIGDTLAWMPYVEEFRIKHKCKMHCSTFHNHLFIKQYPEINFVRPGGNVENLYAMYRIGIMMNEDRSDYLNEFHPSDPKKRPLQAVAADILGLDYAEIKPLLEVIEIPKKRQVSIAIHSTAQAKYWNNSTGWQEVVDYLKSKKYDVLLLSKEFDGYMGNKNPTGIKQIKHGNLSSLIKIIQESELFIGISGGLSWLAWACNVPVILISGFTDEDLEPQNGVYRIINKDVCHGCWSRHNFQPSLWDWCPDHKGTERQFECSKTITGSQVIEKIELILNEE